MNRRERRAQGKSAQAIVKAVELHRAGRIAEAEKHYRKVLAEEPKNADALHLLGVALFQTGRHAEAADFISRAAVLRPDIADIHNHLGVALTGAGRPAEALVALERARALDPAKAEIDLNLGNALRELGRLGEAEDRYRRAIERAPSFAAAHMNLANALRNRGAVGEAVASYRHTVALEPRYADAYMNLGIALKDLGQADEAADAYRKALALFPPSATRDIATTHYNLSIALLVGGHFEEGWREHEWRFHPGAGMAPPRPHRQPRWSGKALGGKKLLVWGEQGVGDEIIHGTMLADLAAAEVDVVLECDPRLAPLFARAFPKWEIVPRMTPPTARLESEDIGAQIPLGSLGALYRRDWQAFPKRAGHIVPDPKRVAELSARYRTLAGTRKIAGISWKSGNARIGRWKSSPLEAWAPIFALKNVLFVDLQYGDTAADRAEALARFGVAPHRDEEIDALKDLDGFAAQVAAVERVISVSNTTVHFAGALGKPVTTLLHQGALWYWFRGRDDSPWYPTMRILRQGPDADWNAVFARAAAELAQSTEQP